MIYRTCVQSPNKKGTSFRQGLMGWDQLRVGWDQYGVIAEECEAELLREKKSLFALLSPKGAIIKQSNCPTEEKGQETLKKLIRL